MYGCLFFNWFLPTNLTALSLPLSFQIMSMVKGMGGGSRPNADP